VLGVTVLNTPTRALTGALVWRAWRGQRLRLILIPLLLACILLALSLLTFYAPGALTGVSHRAVERVASSRYPGISGKAALAMAMLTVQAPHFISAFTASIASSIAVSSFGAESSRGGLENLLAGPYTTREVIYSLGLTSVVLSFFSWIMLTVGTVVIAVVFLLLTGVSLHDAVSGFGQGMLLPLPLTLWGAIVGLVAVLLFPRLAQMRLGTNSSVIQIVAMLPAFVLLIIGISRPNLSLGWVSLGGLLVDLVIAAIALPLIGRGFRREVLLES
jgi:hypothetical protein